MKKCLAEFSLVLIGGGVRDYLLNNTLPNDLDFEIRHTNSRPFDSQQLKELIEREQVYEDVLILPFDIVRIIYDKGQIELSPPRKEIYASKDFFKHNEFQAKISYNCSYKESWIRRDFTINAIGVDLNTQELIDPFGGINDLQQKCLKACENNTFVYDPVRFLRAIRFQIKLGFSLHPDLQKGLKFFNLQGLSLTYFFQEAFKSSRFFYFVHQFFLTAQCFSIPLPKEIKALSFLKSLKINFIPQTLDQLLLCLVYHNAYTTKEQIDLFLKYSQAKESLYKNHRRLRKILEDLGEMKEHLLRDRLATLPLNDFVRLEEVRLLKQFHGHDAGREDKYFLEILEKCNPTLLKTYRKIKALLPQKLEGTQEFQELIKREDIPKHYRGELKIYCHLKAFP